jgi:hypothetical protein
MDSHDRTITPAVLLLIGPIRSQAELSCGIQEEWHGWP